MVEIDCLKILLGIELDAVEHVAREDHETRTARPERHGLVREVGDRAGRIVGPQHEHAGRRIHRGDDLESGPRPADAGERLVGGLAGHQRNVERVGFEQRDVLGRALGIARLNRERRVGRVDHRNDRVAVKRKPAARRRGAKHDRGCLLSCHRGHHHHQCGHDGAEFHHRFLTAARRP